MTVENTALVPWRSYHLDLTALAVTIKKQWRAAITVFLMIAVGTIGVVSFVTQPTSEAELYAAPQATSLTKATDPSQIVADSPSTSTFSEDTNK